MSSDSSSAHDLSHYGAASELGATPGAETAAGHVLPPPPPPPPIRREERPEVLAAVPCAPPPALPQAQPEPSDAPPRGPSFVRLPWTLLLALVRWYREDGFWYVTSAVAHAVALISLALVSLAIPRTALLIDQNAPSFDAPETPETAAPPVAHFNLGDAPIDPTELNADTLAQFTSLPAGAAEEKYYDDSPDFEEAGGGTPLDLTGQQLGGLGGFSVKGPGPGRLGGVGVGVGTGTNAGSGGDDVGFGGRGKGHLRKGATIVGERAVGAALNWFHRHQSPQGKWSIDHRRQCKNGVCTGAGSAQSDAAATAMALLPFLGAGQTHKSKGIYQQTINKGLFWLVKQQKPNGDLSGGCANPMYAHGLATIVLCEAYGMTHDERIGAAARRAVQYIERAQNESTGGWRYVPGDAGDTSVFGWQIMALKSAQLAGLPVNSIVFDNGRRWLRSVAKGEHLGLYCYQPYQPVTPSMTAAGMLCQQYLGANPKDPGMLEGKRSLLENLPDNAIGRDTYYWYYATLAMHNFMDADWDAWNRKVRRVLIESQVKSGCGEGSWDPEKPTPDKWGVNGGRIMTTSLSTLMLEVPYRYSPLFKVESPVPAPAAMGFPEKAAEKNGN